ncbi:MAG: tripartite tricarboxylate transporter TctB family protein [Armatimonadota bacterium]|nr:tripartite tricarboxylate transporter TctB family protein [Armatimonadota bacterium]
MRLTSRGVAALSIVIFSVAYLLEARSYRLGNASNPGAGMFPVALGVALLVVAIAVLWSEHPERAGAAGAVTAPPTPAGEARPHPLPRHLLQFFVTVALYPLAIRIAGFELATVVALPAMSLAMGERRPLWLLLLAAGGATATYAIFRLWLAVPLP